VDDDTWHHVALVRRADSRVLLYLDGKAQQPDQAVTAPGPVTTTWRALGARVELGVRVEHSFGGLLDELCVYGRDLSEREIGQLASKLPRERKGDEPPPRPSEPRTVPPLYTLGEPEKARFRGALAASPDGKLLAVASDTGGSARFYDLTTGRPRDDLPEFTGKSPLVFSPDGQYLAGQDVKLLSRVRVLHLPTKALVSWDKPKDGRRVSSGAAGSFSFTADSKYLILADRPPQLVEVATGTGQPLTPPDMLPHYLHLGWDGRTMLLAGESGFRGPTYQCVLADLASGEARKTVTVEVGAGKAFDGAVLLPDTPPALRATEDLKYLAVRSRDRKTVQVWSLAEGRKLTSPPAPGKGFQWAALAWAPDNRTLVLSSTQGLITFWDAAAGKEVGKLRVEGEGEGPAALACSGDGRLLAAGGEAAQVRVWNIEELLGRPFAVPKRPAPPTVATLPEPKLPRRPLTLKELSRFEVVDKSYPSRPYVAISPDGRYLFTTHSLRAALWELPEGKPLISLNKVDIGGATFSSDSRALYWLISRKVERVELPGLKREEVMRDITMHDAPGLSTDDKVLLIGGPGGVLLVDLATKRERRARGEGGRGQSNPVFDPADGRVAAVGYQYVSLMHIKSERYHKIPVTLPGRSFNPRLALRAGRLAIALPLQGAWIRDQKSGQIIGRLPPRDAPRTSRNLDVARPVLSPDGERLFLPSHEELTVWHLKTGEVFEARYPFGRVVGAAISADGRTLALLLEDRRVAVVQVTTEALGVRDP
jgi:WD40 repeat protein